MSIGAGNLSGPPRVEWNVYLPRADVLPVSGDRVEGFLAAVDELSPQLHRYASLRCGSWCDAEDVVAAAVARVFVRLQVREFDDISRYLWRSVTNEVIARARRRRILQFVSLDSSSPDLPASAADLDQRLVLWAAVNRLPRRQREVIFLRYGVGLTERSTADALGIALGTVKSHHAKGLAALRHQLDQRTREAL